LTDEKRVTITTSQETAPGLIQRLKLAGVQATKVSLHGRFHYAKYQKEVDQLIVSCTAVFQFPDVSEMALPSRSNSDGRYISAGKLHEVAIRSILVEQSQWYKTFSEAYSCHFVTGNALCVSFGLERCIPPTLARRLGTRLQAGDSDFLTSGLPGEPLIMHRGDAHVDLSDERIAVIGMACQLPGAENIEDYWNILCNAKSQHREVPRERFTTMDTTWRDADPDRKWFGNFIEDYSTFDHKFFKKSPRETASTDPQQRLMLQIAYQALEQSGYFGNLNDHKHKVGCFLGVGNVDYEDNIACYPATAYSATGNLKSFVAGKISHHFGWTGPSLTIDTACSSSSVAIHYACRSILSGECLSALAGGVNIITSPDWYHNLSGASFLSPTGQCKPFDIASDGYCRGEGVGAVLLKRLSSAIAEGDQILGVLSSTGVSQNGNGTAITVPMSESLSDLFLHVLQKARLKPEDISVIESHGTGTVVGDPAEYQGIQRVFGRTNNPHKVSLTSVKGLIGHTECASGVASLIKVLLMIQERLVPPQASFTSINPRLGLEPRDNIEISTQLKPWDVRFRATLINNYVSPPYIFSLAHRSDIYVFATISSGIITLSYL
jgi:3-oxoacyl-(acyl-carrier-protein) synthase